MGARQNKECVDNVQIPTWAKQDPRLFTLIHMQVCMRKGRPSLGSYNRR